MRNDGNVYRHATSPCEHGDLRFLHPFFVLSPYSQLSPYFTHFPAKMLISQNQFKINFQEGLVSIYGPFSGLQAL